MSRSRPLPEAENELVEGIGEVRIRAAVPGDLETVLGIVRAATRRMDSLGILQWDEVYPDREVLRDDIRGGCLRVVELDGRVAGLIALDDEQPSEYRRVPWRHGGRVRVVHRLTIHPDFQRRGLARRMMEYAERTAAELGYDVIRLDVFTRNPAATGLYDSLGYERAGTVRFRKGEFLCCEKRVKRGKDLEGAAGAFPDPGTPPSD